MNKALLTILMLSHFFCDAQKKDYLLTLKTNQGSVHIILFVETPQHKKNLIKLVKNKFYNHLLFHRIIQNFMIQGGDPNSKNANPEIALGSGGDNLARIPFEFTPKHIHLKGAVAAARDNNPEKSSSGCQFYIVQGKKYKEEELKIISEKNKLIYTPEQKLQYYTVGGTPFLDNNYTVFGTVIDNIEVIDKIAAMPKNKFDRPIENIEMKISVKKIRKRKITKKYGYKFL